MDKRIYVVAYVRDNKVETILRITPSRSIAHLCFVHAIAKYDHEEAGNMLADLAKDPDGHYTFVCTEGHPDSDGDHWSVLNLQLTHWIGEV